MLTLTDVTVTFPGRTALDMVSLTVPDGCVLALLGPSGCGKSTLLRAVAGLEPLAHGRIDWDDVDLARIPVHRRGFGLMFQDGVLFPHRTVGQNVAYGLRAAGMRGPTAEARVAELLGLVGLGGFGDRSVTELSGGEAQRVALARALAPRPRLLLLDEPLAALDRSLRDALLTDLRAILRETGTPAIFVTHDQDEAFAVADRVALMRAGRLVQAGNPAELWAAPVDEWAARFVGYTSVVDGIVEPGSDGTPCVRTHLGRVSMPAGCQGDAQTPGPGATVRVGLRPAALVLDPDGALTARCLAVVPGLERTMLTVDPLDPDSADGDHGATLSAVADRVAAGDGSGVAVGQVVRLRFDPASAAVIGVR